MTEVLILTGTCGSGKTTVSALLHNSYGWERISEDDIWYSLYGKDRGPFRSAEHQSKRTLVHEIVLAGVLEAQKKDQQVVIDATVHESPPEAYQEYLQVFEQHGIQWRLLVLQPRLAVAIARDSQRSGWVAGPERVKQLRAKFTGKVFPAEWFLDTSDESPEETALRVHVAGAA